MDVSNASTKNTESTLNSFDYETPPFVWCFFILLIKDVIFIIRLIKVDSIQEDSS